MHGRIMHRHFALYAAGAILLAGATWLLADRLEDTIYIPLDHPAIHYAGETTDPVGRLEKRLANGQVKLGYAPIGGYLPALLKELNINVDSQALVFSRTSIQVERISPRTPRAIYFNDDVSVGYVQNGEVLEIASLDPKQGVILYSLDAVQSPKPVLARRDDCLRCHQGPVTLAVPGLLISSVHPVSAAPGGGTQLRVHDGSSDPLQRTLGRLVRHRHARRAIPTGQQPLTWRIRSIPVRHCAKARRTLLTLATASILRATSRPPATWWLCWF